MPDSWWLKFKRAQRHMIEVRKVVRAYTNRKPYSIRRIREPDGKKSREWRYRLVMDQIDPMIVMMLGDFVHNLRSALDHVVVANSPKKYRHSAAFPIQPIDLFAKDGRKFISRDKDARKRFRNAIRGLPPLLKTIIIDSQPYSSHTPNTHIVGILSRLENVDKHKKAIGAFPALHGSFTIFVTDQPYKTIVLRDRHFFYGGAQIYLLKVRRGSDLTEADVKMECSGPATIVIKGTGIPGHPGLLEINIRQTMLKSLSTVRLILQAMDGATRRNVALGAGH